jgi:hypothetical protein
MKRFSSLARYGRYNGPTQWFDVSEYITGVATAELSFCCFFIDKDFFICYTKCDKNNKMVVNGNALGRGRLSMTAGKEK